MGGEACKSEEMEAKLRDRKLKSHIHRKGNRGKPVSEQAKGSNRTKSTSRAIGLVRVENILGAHIFGAQAKAMGGNIMRPIGQDRVAWCGPRPRSG